MTDPTLKNRLIALQPIDPAREQVFKQEIAAMWNQKLTRAHRFYWIWMLCGSLLCVPNAAFAALMASDNWIKAVWWFLAVLNVAVAIFAVRVLKHGYVNFRTQLAMGKVGSGIVFGIAMALVIRTISAPSIEALGWALMGIVWLVLVLSINVWNRVIEAENTTREHLLRLELRLTEGTQGKQ